MKLFAALALAAAIMIVGSATGAEAPVVGLEALQYPPWALRQGLGGIIKLSLTANQDGVVTDCKVVGSSGHGGLDADTCRQTLTKFKYPPSASEQTRTFDTTINWRVSGGSGAIRPFSTFQLDGFRGTRAWDFGASLTNETATLSCSSRENLKVCEIPPSRSDIRKDIMAAAKITATLSTDGDRLIGLRLDATSDQLKEAVREIQGRWGLPCYEDTQAGVSGWISGFGFTVLRPGVVTISTKDLDPVTQTVASVCPPHS